MQYLTLLQIHFCFVEIFLYTFNLGMKLRKFIFRRNFDSLVYIIVQNLTVILTNVLFENANVLRNIFQDFSEIGL